LPVESRREGNVCEKCGKENTEVGKMTDYTDPHDGYKGLLCSECITRREKPYTEICPRCHDNAYANGGMTVWSGSDENPLDYDLVCMKCYEKLEKREVQLNKIKTTSKRFGKNNWKFFISITVAIIGITVTYFGLSR